MFLLFEVTVQVIGYGLSDKLVLLEKIYPSRRSVLPLITDVYWQV